MSYGPSQEELDWLKKSDYLLLKLAYQKAVEAGKSQFKVHVSGFEGSPRAMHHIAQFALMKWLVMYKYINPSLNSDQVNALKVPIV